MTSYFAQTFTSVTVFLCDKKSLGSHLAERVIINFQLKLLPSPNKIILFISKLILATYMMREAIEKANKQTKNIEFIDPHEN